MEKRAKLILTILSSVIGLYSGFIIVMCIIIYFFKLLELVVGTDLEAMWMLIMILAFFLGIAGGIIGAVFLWKVSNGKFNSEQWKINRYFLIFLLLIIGIGIFFLLN